MIDCGGVRLLAKELSKHFRRRCRCLASAPAACCVTTVACVRRRRRWHTFSLTAWTTLLCRCALLRWRCPSTSRMLFPFSMASSGWKRSR